MIRTRDLLLFLVCAAFLLVGIGITGLSQLFSVTTTTMPITFNDVDYATSSTEVVSRTLNRQQRLQELQAKIATQDGMSSPSGTDFEPEETRSTDDLAETMPDEVAKTDEDTDVLVQYCPTVKTVARAWPAVAITSIEREGRRLYLTEASEEVTTQIGTTTTTETVVTETIYAHLPIRTSAGATTCIGQDVIGIAQDGSLLRNENYAAYSIFGSDTLIGYALDGLPIYGLSDTIVTDQCGGVMMNGQYRYYLSADRPGMIGCFAAAPVTL